MQRIAVEFSVSKETPFSMPEEFNYLEKRLIETALTQTSGVKASAARLLGLNRTTLVEKMRKHGMPLLPAPGSTK